MTGTPFDHSHDYDDFDEMHPDLQHEQPPAEATEDPADSQPGTGGADDPGELPGSIPDAPADMSTETGEQP